MFHLISSHIRTLEWLQFLRLQHPINPEVSRQIKSLFKHLIWSFFRNRSQPFILKIQFWCSQMESWFLLCVTNFPRLRLTIWWNSNRRLQVFLWLVHKVYGWNHKRNSRNIMRVEFLRIIYLYTWDLSVYLWCWGWFYSWLGKCSCQISHSTLHMPIATPQYSDKTLDNASNRTIPLSLWICYHQSVCWNKRKVVSNSNDSCPCILVLNPKYLKSIPTES
jgi:hypothetical protein